MSSLLDKFTEVEEAVEFSDDDKNIARSLAAQKRHHLKLSSEEVVYWQRHASVKSNSKRYLAGLSDQIAMDNTNLSVCSRYLNIEHVPFLESIAGFVVALLEQAESFFECTRHQNCLRLKSAGEWVRIEFIKAIKQSDIDRYEEIILHETQNLVSKQSEFQPVCLKYNFKSQSESWVAYAVNFSLPVKNKKASKQNISWTRAESI